jgi:glucose/arabinose dehydrogenase
MGQGTMLVIGSAQADLWERAMDRRSFLALAVLIAIPDPVRAQDRIVQAPSAQIRFETIARGLVRPCGLALLPNGQMLVTERPGRLRLVSRMGAYPHRWLGSHVCSHEGRVGCSMWLRPQN